MKCKNCPYYDFGLAGQYCDKTGGKTLVYGYCTDVYDTDILLHKNQSKQKRRNKRERDQKYRKHLKFLAENICSYPSPAIYTDKVWINEQGYVQNPKPYYKRLYRGQRSKYLKKISNKTIRRYKSDIPKKGNWSYKLYDFWYEMY